MMMAMVSNGEFDKVVLRSHDAYNMSQSDWKHDLLCLE